MTQLMWFRHDLRLSDNPALYHACRSGGPVVACYVHCQAFEHRHAMAAVRLDFIRRSLAQLSTELQALGIPLHPIKVAQAADIAPALAALAQQHGASGLFCNAEYPVDELQRDRAVYKALQALGVKLHRYHDRVLIPPGELLNGQGQPFKVFTAFKNKWLSQLPASAWQPLPAPKAIGPALAGDGDGLAAINALFEGAPVHTLGTLWPTGEAEAAKRLHGFMQQGLSQYAKQRDLPALAGTSSLSPYFTHGVLSPRQALAAVALHTQGQWQACTGASTWVNELIWRDFYQHTVVQFPQVCWHQPLQPYTQGVHWQGDGPAFQAWCAGQTGVPLVDAAMRQLLHTGWMHNRLRMVSAMFLTKNLLVDWRLGEAFFMRHLIDGDFAANNGGWQWCASTGSDAVPYFRVFNPYSQAQRFDPNGQFVREWLPELAPVALKHLFCPIKSAHYPTPIVDVGESRKAAMQAFAQAQAVFKNAPKGG